MPVMASPVGLDAAAIGGVHHGVVDPPFDLIVRRARLGGLRPPSRLPPLVVGVAVRDSLCDFGIVHTPDYAMSPVSETVGVR